MNMFPENHEAEVEWHRTEYGKEAVLVCPECGGEDVRTKIAGCICNNEECGHDGPHEEFEVK